MSASAATSSAESNAKHVLEDKAFKSPTKCDCCGDTIWGFGKNKRCTVCKMAFHKKCASMKLPGCSGEPVSANDSGERKGTVIQASGEVVDLAAANNVLHQKVMSACDGKEYESIKKFLQNKAVVKPMFTQLDEFGCTPLQVAVQRGDIVVVDAIISAMDPGDVNALDRLGNTALHEACKASATKNDRVLEALLAAPGLDATIANADDNTALHYFCQKYSTVNCAQLGGRMLELGGMSLVVKQNKNQETALHYAMFNPSFRLPMARFLIKATTGELNGPTSSTHGESEIPRHDSSEGLSAKNVADDAGAKFLNAQNSKGETALHYGVRMLRPDVVQLLLGAGADHRLKNKAGESPRDLAEVLHSKTESRSNAAAAAVTSGDPLPLIIAALDNATFLREWLEQSSIDLGMLVGNFVRGGVTKDELPELTEQHLTDMGIKSAGHRIRLMKAIREVRKKTATKKKKPKKRGSKHKEGDDKATDDKDDKDDDKEDEKADEPAAAEPDFGSARMNSIKQQLEKLQYIKVDAGDWIDPSCLEFLEELGSGACGTVMRGVYRHPKDGSVHPVAIKVLKEAETDKETEEFKKEFQILSAVKSPYMVHFFGAQLSPKLCMVMELCDKGSVWKVLQNEAAVKVGWPQFLEWGVQLASGVWALHSNDPQIVHRDLKTLNLLLNRDWIIKVCDFGLSRFSTSSNLETLAKMRGTMAYCFPEHDHQLLTNRGFMFLDDVEAHVVRGANGAVIDWRGLQMASYDPVSRRLVYQQPHALVVNTTPTPLVEFTDAAEVARWAAGEKANDGSVAGESRNLSIVATPTHAMYVRTATSNVFETMNAARVASLKGDVHFLSAAVNGVDASSVDDTASDAMAVEEQSLADVVARLGLCGRAQVVAFLELYGFWLATASSAMSDDDAVVFECRDIGALVFVRSRLALVGLDYATSERGTETRLSISKRSWVDVMMTMTMMTEAGVATFASWTRRLDRAALWHLLSGLMVASGGSAVIRAPNVAFRDDLVVLLMHAGCSSTFSRADGDDASWNVYWDAQRSEPVLCAASDVVREIASYSGRTWCFAADARGSGFVVVRRALRDKRGVRGNVIQASRATLQRNCPPEAYFGERFTDRSDVYSVGVILWEMANRCIKGEYNRPFYEFPNMALDFQIIIQVARKSKRPTLPPSTPAKLSDLINRCWQKDRDTRPSAGQVRDELHALQAEYETDPAPWNASYVGKAAEMFENGSGAAAAAAPAPSAVIAASTSASVLETAASTPIEVMMAVKSEPALKTPAAGDAPAVSELVATPAAPANGSQKQKSSSSASSSSSSESSESGDESGDMRKETSSPSTKSDPSPTKDVVEKPAKLATSASTGSGRRKTSRRRRVDEVASPRSASKLAEKKADDKSDEGSSDEASGSGEAVEKASSKRRVKKDGSEKKDGAAKRRVKVRGLAKSTAK